MGIHSLHRISKYANKEGTAPVLNKLGSGAWAMAKQKAKKKIKEVAYDLIKLYAKRKMQRVLTFSQILICKMNLKHLSCMKIPPINLKPQ